MRPRSLQTPPPPAHETQRIEYDAADQPLYHGWAQRDPDKAAPDASEPVWRIVRYTWDGLPGNCTTIEWADADQNYDNVWDDRAVLAYG